MNVLFIREDQNAKAKIHLNSAHRQGAYALFKYVVFLPELRDFLLPGKEVQIALHLFVNAHCILSHKKK